MNYRIKLLTALIIFSVNIIHAQTIYEWRGPDRSGVYNETGLLKVWPAEGPSILWEASEVGTGYSSVTVSDDAVYITGRKGENDVLTSFTQDGKKNWEVIYGKSWMKNFPESRCTPTISKNNLFLVSGMGDMVCISRDGKIVWSVNYFEKFSGKIPQFGISESPLVVDNKVIGTPGGDKASVIALNSRDGKTVWVAESVKDETHYVNPLLVDFKGKKIIITLTDSYIIGVDVISGKLMWKFNYTAENISPDVRKNHTNTPIFRDGYLFVSSGYDNVALKLKLSADGSVPTVVWKNNDLDPHVGGAVLLGNYLYGSNWETNSFGKWVCVDWNTGKTLWISDWYNKGSIISADGMLYIYEEKSGHIGLVKPGTEKLEVVSQFQIKKGSGPHWAHPVIDKGRLFVRHGDYLGVYSIK